ncbi:hypothetical protein SRM_02335 [Salinibacter ruber M8]|uniref:Uncharacterized protein n=1 Tax=Salinibacter ruber (strain M8) TaxID=761659 RepID=D5HB51_SALRM|nr:hypothetical protein SRM_02335 [Salinibacter ruber M8]
MHDPPEHERQSRVGAAAFLCVPVPKRNGEMPKRHLAVHVVRLYRPPPNARGLVPTAPTLAASAARTAALTRKRCGAASLARGRLSLLRRGVLGSLLDDTLLLAGVDKEVGDDAQGNKDRREGPCRLLEHVGGLSGAEHLAGGPAGGDAREALPLAALHEDHQDENGRNEGDEDDHE